MLTGINKNGEQKNILVTDEGKVVVKISDEEQESTSQEETTLNASVQTIGTSATTIEINKKVTQIDIANYSKSANITLTAGGISAVIGANIATTLKVNKQVNNLTLTSIEEGTKVQLVVSGVE